MFSLKQIKGFVPALLIVASLTGNAYASVNTLAQTPETPAAESETTASDVRPISETKRLLIDQLLELTGGRQMHEQMQQAAFTQVQQQLQPLVAQLVENRGDLSPAEADALMAELNTNFARISEVIQTEVTYDEMLERVYYPSYDQYFTEEDLKGLIAFYQTPLGEKLTVVSPQLTQTSMQLSSQVYMPRILDIVTEMMQQTQ
ncbi:MAG TPA: DUF2059 domain-containing protein [Trichocoleus sp.]